ncbi:MULTISPECIES: FadR/GntR family transcriptional regulator [unclassified Pseudomonas]|uniref:FadR/GntR family transcriptional regulator n=1 Tax=unclassified Pseudomonas TaxID=196821 RepID=UPI002AC92805|nr:MULTISPECIES: FadR/GntR family transcriptional regulator [unclassified Pseudomonas]MEB0040946.1 FadR/GntR family transcriptional regulator [Pseudomonas sp. MH10]MEB0078924.1 FadR/GntR family transcriptional regulator [Pseudomonas sp. MH10out]MEB0089994.1 FadR/GntR family transcriptional regulator [Pseudomonas sp. CCI4.2]MEB0102012.1 FadR/GntR family transcriptional regulator [Pseudomonas sp. CCI3.2]MEB0120994.1 FadR/GntR family transcriptional regulator [Pseudomonas sp. CCI1.2]
MHTLPPVLTKRRPNSLATDLVTQLSQRILLGKISPGEKLPSESEIVREHGVSRTVVREAISKLQASGLVETRHGIGTFVLEHRGPTGMRLKVETAASVRDIIELRIGLETQAVALAALRRTDEQLGAMRQALDDYQDLLAKEDSCVEADRRFHLLIAEATGNPCFVEIMQHLGPAMIPRSRIGSSERRGINLAHHGYLANLEHEALLSAIRRQDPDAARAAMWTHLSNSRERLAPLE